MSTYTYTDYNKESFETLYNKLVILGDHSPVLTMNGHLKVTTTLTESQVNGAVASVEIGEIASVKALKILEVEAVSDELISQGAATWDSDHHVELSEDEFDKRQVKVTYYTDNPTELSASDQYIVGTINGGIVSTYSVDDIKTLVANMKHRLDYIYLSLVDNADGSCSEMLLRGNISAATTIEQVNAITDTRS